MTLVLDNTVLSNFALSRDEGNLVLREMIGHGYRCPVEHL